MNITVTNTGWEQRIVLPKWKWIPKYHPKLKKSLADATPTFPRFFLRIVIGVESRKSWSLVLNMYNTLYVPTLVSVYVKCYYIVGLAKSNPRYAKNRREYGFFSYPDNFEKSRIAGLYPPFPRVFCTRTVPVFNRNGPMGMKLTFLKVLFTNPPTNIL